MCNGGLNVNDRFCHVMFLKGDWLKKIVFQQHCNFVFMDILLLALRYSFEWLLLLNYYKMKSVINC